MDLTPGAIGCFLSHLNVYEKIMKTADNDKYYLIIEDDTEFNIDFDNTILNNEIKNIPTDWDIILLNYIIKKTDLKVKNKVLGFYRTDCYLIKKKGVEKIFANHSFIYNQIDSFLSELADKGILNIYHTNTKLAKQNDNYKTNIQIYGVK